ncbi:aminotransferase class V-fold PLP-dependent enzyme [Microbacterium aerolatum]|uniref:Aspartate aminotransferase family protein n=1 Tax=Microbacterium aerolatum TaxID=153731 RepID=A0A511ADD2_9MICO|nr:aminotransferase class V-fold PLP-dependent enzyme [Microbacterium aerolatum]MCK3768128.1 aminotransferase class V-fold PLP-dependent enzyme [Microbacterium aerolatum]GEK86072.1 aspartate aminotransferase family protein [Microbacterium aerolatum]GGB27104.1 aspartate aminotransferase family protein [Microbacterium aerolatum]
MDERERALDAAHRHAAGFLESLDDRPVWPRASLDEMVAAFGGPLAEEGLDPAAVVDEIAERADPGLVAIPGGRFFGFVIGGTHPAALAADWLVSAWDQNSGSSLLTPATVAMERVAGKWMLELFGLPSTASVGFVTGGQLANFTCLATARTAVLARAGWDLAERGLRSAPPIRFVVGADRHGSVDRAARFLGIGRAELTVVESDDQGRMRPDALESALDYGRGPLIVCLQAGEVHTGAFDDFGILIPIARRHEAWVHVDGAFGLWAAASPSLRPLTAGAEAADSWATDAHKTLNVPYDCGMAIVRDPQDSIAAFRTGGDYLIYSGLDPWDVTPELSRRARGVPAWAALRSLGRVGIARLLDGLHANAVAMAKGLTSVDGVEVLNDVDYTQVMFCLGEDDATRALGEAILADGTAAVTGAEWRGRAVLRCSMSSWATTAEDIDRTVTAIRRLVAA